jgi:hypothetical protein
MAAHSRHCDGCIYLLTAIECCTLLARQQRLPFSLSRTKAWRRIFWLSLPPGVLFVAGSFFITESRAGVAPEADTLHTRSEGQGAVELEEMNTSASRTMGENQMANSIDWFRPPLRASSFRSSESTVIQLFSLSSQSLAYSIFLTIAFFLPETKSKTLEQIERFFDSALNEVIQQ